MCSFKLKGIDMKTIVFARNGISPRMYNHAFALKQSKKYRLVLFCKNYDSYTLAPFKKVFDEIICYQPHVLDIKNFVLAQNVKSLPMVHHIKGIITEILEPPIKKISWKRVPNIFKSIDADAYSCCGADILTELVLKNTDKPVIMDLHNGSASAGIENLPKEEQVIDKYCYENVAGIIHRGSKHEIKYYKDHGYKIKCPIHVYLDSTNHDLFADVNTKKLSKEDGEIHIVGMGAGMNELDLHELIYKLIKQKMHYHLYLVPYSNVGIRVFRKLVEMNKTEKYFHFHQALPFDKIVKETAKYDFAAKIDTPDHLNRFLPIYPKIGVAYRIYAFLDAGLPVLLSDSWINMFNILNKYKAVIPVSHEGISTLRKTLESYNYEKLKKNVIKAREGLSIKKQKDGLVKFYDSIIEK